MAGARTWIDRAGRALALTLTAFAILLQTNAPVQSTLMMVGGDGGGVICSVHGDKGDDQHRSPAQRHDACAACSVCQAGGAILVADGVPVPASATPGFIVRAIRPAILNPRGPPLRAANARAPPILA